MILHTKYEYSGHCGFRQEDFENCIFETYFIGPLERDYPGIIPVKFGQNLICGFREDV